MASPVKAFVDPSGVSTMVGRPTPVVTSIVPIATAAVCLLNEFHPLSLVVMSSYTVAVPLGPNPRIPLPPMGRQTILTFPPIYKERPTSEFVDRAIRPDQGQQWPRKVTPR